MEGLLHTLCLSCSLMGASEVPYDGYCQRRTHAIVTRKALREWRNVQVTMPVSGATHGQGDNNDRRLPAWLTGLL
jgi:hypothetical protein